jgi:hypothetical protein
MVGCDHGEAKVMSRCILLCPIMGGDDNGKLGILAQMYVSQC